jgi:hypothetical protein
VLFEGFGLEIPEADRNEDQYSYLRHGQQFSVRLRNVHPTRCNATLKLNGEDVGTWRLQPWQVASIEHGVFNNKRFTFYREGTYEAKNQGLRSGREENGLVVAVFVPEDTEEVVLPDLGDVDEFGYPGERHWDIPKGLTPYTYSNSQRLTSRAHYLTSTNQAGVIGTSGYSAQDFGTAGWMPLDMNRRVEIAIRLLVQPEPVKPRIAAKPRSTGIPPRR